MARKRFTAEQIISKLRAVPVPFASERIGTDKKKGNRTPGCGPPPYLLLGAEMESKARIWWSRSEALLRRR